MKKVTGAFRSVYLSVDIQIKTVNLKDSAI